MKMYENELQIDLISNKCLKNRIKNKYKELSKIYNRNTNIVIFRKIK